ncbi:MAG: NADH-quinone oxidoreductase subunit L [Bacteroidota bacterium]
MLTTKSGLLAALIPLLPLLGFLINGLGFRRLPIKAAAAVGIGAAFGSFVLSCLLFNDFLANGSVATRITYFNWISSGAFSIDFSFQIDQLSLIMLMIITGVGTLIHLYSDGYMLHDKGFGKFFAFLNLFLFNMLLLVLGSNYVIMFIGWEGVGLCSYLLIGYWNTNTAYNNAARKAFIMNRIGDLGFLLGIFMLISYFGTTEYAEIFSKARSTFPVNDVAIVAITALLFVGATGKSAQIPLFTWLPDAMAGPTPVSALIHAATMVTAGIYMVIRSNVLYALAPATLEVVGIIGLATALFAATIGIFQNDIKKVLAYSTVSQLGYMFLALGVGAYTASMFHVITHAFFKALLFLGAGSVIHAMSEEQDIRRMGGLSKALPVTYITFLVGTIAIAGIPPFSGFFSKDEILAHVYAHSPVMWGFGVLTSLMTSFYMFRLLFLTFSGDFRGNEHQKSHLHESPVSMLIPLVVLAMAAAAGGLLGLPEVFSHHHLLSEFMAPLFAQADAAPSLLNHHVPSHSEEITLMAVSVAAALVAMGLAWFMFVSQKKRPAAEDEKLGFLQNLVYNKYYIDELYDNLVVTPLNALSRFFSSVMEVLVIDNIVNAVGKAVEGGGAMLRRTQTGAIGVYVFIMVIAVTAILLFNFGIHI